jgi:peroxiredoxin
MRPSSEAYKSNLEPTSALKAGTQAPDFSLRSTLDQAVSLSDFRGQPVILAFYPADWSPVCGDQMTLYNEVLPEFPGADGIMRALESMSARTATTA